MLQRSILQYFRHSLTYHLPSFRLFMSGRLRLVLLCAKVLARKLRSFIKALKVSCLQRILHQSKPNEWTYLSLINFHNIFSIGGSYAFKLSSELQNLFWKDLIHIWAEFCKIYRLKIVAKSLAPLYGITKT